MPGELVLAKTFIEIGYRGFDQIAERMNQAVSVARQTVKNAAPDFSADFIDATFTIKPTKVQSIFGQLRKELGNVGKSIMESLKPLQKYLKNDFIDDMGSSFRRGSAAILDFSRSGSPLAFNTLSASVELLKSRVGSAFTPVILSAAKSVQQLSDWIKNLDPETRKTIATWTALGVAGAGLIYMFGGLVVAVGKFAFSVAAFAYANPLVTSLLAVAGAAAKAYYEIERLKVLREEGEKARIRIASGGMTEADVEGSVYAKELEGIADPKKRKARAQEMADQLIQKGKGLEQQYDEQSGFWNGGALKSLFTGAAVNTAGEIQKINKELQIIANYFNAADTGAKPTVARSDSKPVALSGARGLAGAKAGTGSLDAAYSGLNNLALGMDDIQRQILKEQMEATKAAQESAKNIQSIQDWLSSVGKG